MGLCETLALDIAGTDVSPPLQAMGLPIRFDGERQFNAHVSARVGQDSQAVLAAVGLTPQDIDALAAEGAVQI